MCLQFIFFYLRFFWCPCRVGKRWACVCVWETARVCACTERGFVEIWSGHLLIKNLASVAGFKKPKHTSACLSRQPDTSVQLRRSWRVTVQRLSVVRVSRRLHDTSSSQHAAVFHHGYMTDVGVGKHSRLVATDAKLLTLSKGQANWNIDQRNIWISRVLRYFISPKIDRRLMRYVEWKHRQECKQHRPWSSISARSQHERSSDFQEMFYEL